MSRSENPQIINAHPKPGRPAISEDKKREMREKIASSTQQLFQTEGFRQISMRRIAKEVGCSPMTLYKYYDTKIDILHTLWGDIFDAAFNKLEELNLDNMSPRAQLGLLASAYVNYWLENTEHYRLVFMTEGVNQPDVGMFIEDPDIVTRYQVFAVATINASSGELSQDEIMQKIGAMICFLHGIAHNLITISGYNWPATDYLVNAAITGILDERG